MTTAFTITAADIGRYVRQISTGRVGLVKRDHGNGWIHPGVVYEWQGYLDDLEYVTVTPDTANSASYLEQAGRLILYGPNTIQAMNANAERVARALAAAERRGREDGIRLMREAALSYHNTMMDRAADFDKHELAQSHSDGADAIRALDPLQQRDNLTAATGTSADP